jgi:hypothetical protein
MRRVSRYRRASLGTMLILSAIDVLLCSFTAGVALFLMGEVSSSVGHAEGRGAQLTKQYVYIESVDSSANRLRCESFVRYVGGGLWHIGYCDFAQQRGAGQTVSVVIGDKDKCEMKRGGTTWIVTCASDLESQALATITSPNAATVSARVIARGHSFVCSGQVDSNGSVLIFGNLSQSQTPNFKCRTTSD